MSELLANRLAQLQSLAIVERIGWLLIHSLWQFTLIALLALLLDVLLRRASAASRYASMLIALLLIAVLPLLTWPLLPQPAALQAPPSPVGTAPTMHIDATASVPAVTVAAPAPVHAVNTSEYRNPLETPHGAVDVAGSPPWRMDIAVRLRPWLSAIVSGWCLGVALFSIRLLWSWRVVRRLQSVGVAPVGSSVAELFQRLCDRLQIAGHVQVLESTVVNTPMVVGGLRSVILLPTSFISGVPLSQLEAILAHELAHVARHDYFFNLLQTCIETLFFYHPAVWWLSHRIRVERENCCDDRVVSALGNRVEYSRALLAVEEFRNSQPSLALHARGGSLLARVSRLLEDTPPDNRRPSAIWVAIAATLMGFAISIGAMTASDTMADASSIPPSTRRPHEGQPPEVIEGAGGPIVDGVDKAPKPAGIHVHGEIRGRLLNDSDKPVAGAVVACGAVYRKDGKSGGTRATTDADGRFRLLVDSPGIYTVYLKSYAANPVLTAAADDGLQVEAKQVTHAQLRLIAGHKVTGTAHDATGMPISDLKVMCYSAARPQSLGGVQSATTKDNGSFEFYLPPGPARIYASQRTTRTAANPGGYLRASVSVKVAVDDTVAPQSLVLAPDRTPFGSDEWLSRSTPGTRITSHVDQQDVTGVVVDGRGKPLPNTLVIKTGAQPVTTDPLGRFRVPCDRGSQFVMHAFHPGYRVWFGAPTAGDQLQIVMAPRLEASNVNAAVDEDAAPGDGTGRAFVDAGTLPDSLNVMAVGFDGTEKLWSLATRKRVTLRSWNVGSGERLSHVELETDKHANQYLQSEFQFSADRTRVFAVHRGKILIWKVSTGKLLATLEPPHGQRAHRGLSCSANGARAACGLSQSTGFLASDASTAVWDVATGKLLRTVSHEDAVQIQSTALSRDGQLLATGSQEAGLCVWEVNSGERRFHLKNENKGRKHPDPEVALKSASQVVALRFSPDDSQLAMADLLGVKLLDPSAGKLIHDCRHPYRYGRSALVFTRDGQRLARVGADKSIPIWSTRTGKLISELDGASHAGSFSVDGGRFAIGSTDDANGIRIWESRDAADR